MWTFQKSSRWMPATRDQRHQQYPVQLSFVKAGEFRLVLRGRMPMKGVGMRILANLAIQLCDMFGVVFL